MKVEPNREIRINSIVDEFDKHKSSYDLFKDCLNGLLNQIIKSSDVIPHDVSTRRKSRQSLIKKIKQPGKEYAELKDITDIVGVRITTYFENDVDKIKNSILQEFDVDPENTIDKRKDHDPDTFGYMSFHCIISLNDERLKHVEYAGFKNLKAEIQIRSILQHTWAAISHDLGYKSKYAIPHRFQRRFSLLSSLLELADGEFLEIKRGLEEYDSLVTQFLETEPGKVFIDKNSVIVMCSHHQDILLLDEVVCEITEANLTSNPDYSENIARMLLWNNIKKASDLFEHIENYKSLMETFAIKWISQKQYQEFNEGISLMYICYIVMAEEGDEAKINRFASEFSLGQHVENFGKRLIDTYNQSCIDYKNNASCDENNNTLEPV